MQNGFLLQKATPVAWDCGHKTHQVDDDVLGKVGAHVRMQMIANGGNHSEYVIVRSCGKGAFIPCSDFQPPIDVERRELLREICV